MKKKRIILVALPFLLLLVFSGVWRIYDAVEQRKEKENRYALSEEEKKLLKNGDVILRYGFGMISDYIVQKFQEPYKISHCGIIMKNDSGTFVIHSESSSMFVKEGVMRQPLDQFVDASHENSVIVVRHVKNEEYSEDFMRSAQYYLKKEIEFDYSFDIEDTTKMFCSELILNIFKQSYQEDIFQDTITGKTNIFQFRNFYDSKNFKVILNHHK